MPRPAQGPDAPIGIGATVVGFVRGYLTVGFFRRRRSERRRTGSDAERGQALLEFALVAPIMVLILVGLVQIAVIFERQIGIENAIRDTARRAATFTTDNTNFMTRQTWVLNNLETETLPNAQGFQLNGLESDSACYSDQTDASGYTSVKLTVSATYKHPLFLPIISGILSSASPPVLRVTTSSTFTVQNDATGNASVGGTNLCLTQTH